MARYICIVAGYSKLNVASNGTSLGVEVRKNREYATVNADSIHIGKSVEWFYSELTVPEGA